MLAALVILCSASASVIKAEDSVTLPFDQSVNADRMVVYRAGINGKGPFACFFDTGASVVALSPDLAKELKVTLGESTGIAGAGSDKVAGNYITLQRLSFGDADFTNVPAVAVPYPTWLPFRCIAGGALLSNVSIRLDFDKRQLTFVKPTSFEYHGTGQVVPLTINEGNLPVVDAEFEGFPGRFMVDTGGGDTISLGTEFVAKHNLGKRYPKALESGSLTITGISKSLDVRAGSLKLAGHTFKSLPATLQVERQNDHPGVDGIIGIRLLRRFNIVFDAPRSRAFFEPRRLVDEPFIFDRTGMGVNPSEHGLIVMFVDAEGPAKEAGVLVGDQIVGVNGKPASSADAIRLADLSIQPIGTKLRVVLLRGTKRIPATITLRDVL